jgi:transposase
MPVASGPEGSAATEHTVRLSQLVELEWHSGSHAPRALRGVPRAKRTGSESDRRHHRQPEREKRRKRGAWIDPHGYDAGKKIKGKKRHILVDTLGLLLHAIVHSADVQDRDGGIMLLATMFGMHPFLRKLFADAAYQGPGFHNGLVRILPHLETEIVKRSDHARGFEILPKRWIVERTIAWLNRCRRLAKDWENLNRKGLAFLRLASIRLMLRKLCNPV